MSRDGKDREVFAWGVRNSVGMDFNPKDKTLWFTDNQVDGMGDDIPPGELNRADKPGMNFGFPYYGGGKTRTNEYKDAAGAGRRDVPAGRDGGARRRPRHDVLLRHACSRRSIAAASSRRSTAPGTAPRRSARA